MGAKAFKSPAPYVKVR